MSEAQVTGLWDAVAKGDAVALLALADVLEEQGDGEGASGLRQTQRAADWLRRVEYPGYRLVALVGTSDGSLEARFLLERHAGAKAECLPVDAYRSLLALLGRKDGPGPRALWGYLGRALGLSDSWSGAQAGVWLAPGLYRTRADGEQWVRLWMDQEG
jgi:hypothetical protein